MPSDPSLLQDTAGQERYRTITTAYYRGAMGFLLMYDIANQESFAAVQDWYVLADPWPLTPDPCPLPWLTAPPLPRATQIKTYSWDNAQVIVVGNKCDLEDERVVAAEDGRRLADDLGQCLPGPRDPGPSRTNRPAHCPPFRPQVPPQSPRLWALSREACAWGGALCLLPLGNSPQKRNLLPRPGI